MKNSSFTTDDTEVTEVLIFSTRIGRIKRILIFQTQMTQMTRIFFLSSNKVKNQLIQLNQLNPRRKNQSHSLALKSASSASSASENTPSERKPCSGATPVNYHFVNSNSLYFGSGHISSSISISRLSIWSRILSRYGRTVSS